jgi:hypothetical protein
LSTVFLPSVWKSFWKQKRSRQNSDNSIESFVSQPPVATTHKQIDETTTLLSIQLLQLLLTWLTNYRPADLDSSDEEDTKAEEEEWDDDGGGVDVVVDDDDVMTATVPEATGTPSPPALQVRVGNTAVVTSHAFAGGSVASSRKLSHKKPRRGSLSNPLMDKDTVQLLSAANESSKDKIDELKRHHQQLETIEKEKLDLEKKKYDYLKWKGKRDELDYKMKLIADYQKLKELGIPDDRIACFCPEMKGVIEVFNGEHSSNLQR